MVISVPFSQTFSVDGLYELRAWKSIEDSGPVDAGGNDGAVAAWVESGFVKTTGLQLVITRLASPSGTKILKEFRLSDMVFLLSLPMTAEQDFPPSLSERVVGMWRGYVFAA
jgi:hypothetical protein